MKRLKVILNYKDGGHLEKEINPVLSLQIRTNHNKQGYPKNAL